MQIKVSSPLVTRREVRSMQDPHYYACKDVKILVTNVGMTQMSGTKRKKTRERETLGKGREPFTSSVLSQVKEIKEGSESLDISSGS